MAIVVIGINHKTAEITIREKVYFAMDNLSHYLNDIVHSGIAREAILLSTCNRSELYCDTDDVDAACHWFAAQTQVAYADLKAALYIHRNEDACAHLMSVACGLDSMVLGEPQIFGQLKNAFSESCVAGTVGSLLHRLFQQVFATAKEIRTITTIGACPVSIASAAINFARQQYPAISSAKILLIGAGSTIELLIRYLAPHLNHAITVVNRSIENAHALSEALQNNHSLKAAIKVYGLNDLVACVQEADIVFSATGSAMPILTKEMLLKHHAMRQNKKLLLIDLAIPRDIETRVSELENVALYCIDDMKMMVETNLRGREHAANKARELIQQRTASCIAELNSLNHVAQTIRIYRGQIEEICRAELKKAKQQIQQGSDPVETLEMFAHAFTNKLLHAPSVQLRQAGVEGRFELLTFAKQLFAIPDFEIDPL